MPDAESPLVMRASVWGEVVVTAFFALLTVTLAVGPHEGLDVMASVASGFLALIGVASLVVRPRLEVTRTTMTDVGLFSRRTFDLRRCGRFHARHYWGRGARSAVTFDYIDVGRLSRRPGWANPRRRAPNASVETHGHDAEALAALLNEARDHARRTSPNTGSDG